MAESCKLCLILLETPWHSLASFSSKPVSHTVFLNVLIKISGVCIIKTKCKFFHLTQVAPHLNSLPDGSTHLTTKTSRIENLPSKPSWLNDWIFSATSWQTKISWASFFQDVLRIFQLMYAFPMARSHSCNTRFAITDLDWASFLVAFPPILIFYSSLNNYTNVTV